MNIGKANPETHQNLESKGFRYDETNKAYYEVTQEGVNKLFASDDKVCKPDSNLWEKPEDRN